DAAERRLFLFACLHEGMKFALRRDIETGSDAASIQQSLVGPDAENKRGKAAGLACGGPAAAGDRLPSHALPPPPLAVAGRAVGGVSSFGDDTFQSQAAGLPGDPLSPSLFMVAVANAVASADKQLMKPLLAFEKRQLTEVLLTKLQEIEHEIGKVAAAFL